MHPATPCTDWYAWLGRTSLDTAAVREYALLFARNELEEEDAAHFDHDLLLSMGVSIAKHRLEILKLAAKCRRRSPRPTSAHILAAARRVGARILGGWKRRGKDGGPGSELAIVPVRLPADKETRRGLPSMLKRTAGGPLRIVGRGRLLLTDGSAKVAAATGAAATAITAKSRIVFDGRRKGVTAGKELCRIGEDEALKWDFLFHGMKPT